MVRETGLEPAPTKRRLEPESSASANSAIPACGGQGWIRTTEVTDGRFTVCSLWPLGNLPTCYCLIPKSPDGAGEGNRTRNLLITNQLLCQLSYASLSIGSAATAFRQPRRSVSAVASATNSIIHDSPDLSSVFSTFLEVFCPVIFQTNLRDFCPANSK